MTAILVFLQHNSNGIPKAALTAVTAAQQLKGAWSKANICAVCLGQGAAAAAERARSYGFSTVYHCEDPVLEKYLSVPYSQALHAAMNDCGADTLVMAATSTGKDVAPRVAALLDAAQASDIVGVNSDGTLRRPMYAGNVLADVELVAPKRVVTVRTTAFAPAAASSPSGEAKALSASFDTTVAGEVVSYEISSGERPELGDAEIVVSGGRAMQSAENFQKYIFPLADAFGAAVGASRAAVDSGYAPNDWQVGQTGKVVAPNLYVAVGISGAIQHLAGMKDSKTIVAINKDPDAPIFEVADYGLVADLYQAVPQLTEAVKKAKSQ